MQFGKTIQSCEDPLWAPDCSNERACGAIWKRNSFATTSSRGGKTGEGWGFKSPQVHLIHSSREAGFKRDWCNGSIRGFQPLGEDSISSSRTLPQWRRIIWLFRQAHDLEIWRFKSSRHYLLFLGRKAVLQNECSAGRRLASKVDLAGFDSLCAHHEVIV